MSEVLITAFLGFCRVCKKTEKEWDPPEMLKNVLKGNLK